MTTAAQTMEPSLPAHPAHGLTMKKMLLVGGAVVRIYFVLRLILEHTTNERSASAAT